MSFSTRRRGAPLAPHTAADRSATNPFMRAKRVACRVLAPPVDLVRVNQPPGPQSRQLATGAGAVCRRCARSRNAVRTPSSMTG